MKEFKKLNTEMMQRNTVNFNIPTLKFSVLLSMKLGVMNEWTSLTRSSNSSTSNTEAIERKCTEVYPIQIRNSCIKMLCGFQFNTSVSRLTSLMGASWLSSTNFCSLLVCIEVSVVPGSSSIKPFRNSINVWPRTPQNCCLKERKCCFQFKRNMLCFYSI